MRSAKTPSWPVATEPVTVYPGEWHPAVYPPPEFPRRVFPAPITDPALTDVTECKVCWPCALGRCMFCLGCDCSRRGHRAVLLEITPALVMVAFGVLMWVIAAIGSEPQEEHTSYSRPATAEESAAHQAQLDREALDAQEAALLRAVEQYRKGQR